MRRITVFADEEKAKSLVAVLENNGYDFMAEDYAEPSIKRRDPPERRAPPERVEPSPGMLMPTRRPVVEKKPPARVRGRPTSETMTWVAQILRHQGEDDYSGIMKLAEAERKDLKKVRDTLRRAVKRGAVCLNRGVYRLPENSSG